MDFNITLPSIRNLLAYGQAPTSGFSPWPGVNSSGSTYSAAPYPTMTTGPAMRQMNSSLPNPHRLQQTARDAFVMMPVTESPFLAHPRRTALRCENLTQATGQQSGGDANMRTVRGNSPSHPLDTAGNLADPHTFSDTQPAMEIGALPRASSATKPESPSKKPHKCSKCPKYFARKTHRRTHERTHTGERPYRCEVTGCDWKFGHPSDLIRHSRTHTGEQPYKCSECPRRFSVRSNCNRHRKAHDRYTLRVPVHGTR